MKLKYKKSGFSDQKLQQLYLGMLKPRLIEEKMLSLLRQGKVSKWFSGIGQEAIAVAATMALSPDEWIFPMHRNLGVFTSREIPLHRLFAQWQGKPDGFTQGRDRSFHFGSKDYHVWGMISHLGPQLSLASGIALANRINNIPKACIAFTGEGGTSEGEFHEALNVAAVWDLPVIFLIENNGYGLSTPVSEQFKCVSLADKGKGYGMEAHSVDGNNIIELYKLLNDLTVDIRKKPRPILVECRTFRMRGHEEASGTKYVPDALMAAWSERDPISNFERFLIGEGIIDKEYIESHTNSIKKEIKSELEKAAGLPALTIDATREVGDVFSPSGFLPSEPTDDKVRSIRFVDAVSEALDAVMAAMPNSVLMGQDIADYGGVFKITEGFVERYGKDRVRNTPLCESAILGIALGMSMEGMKPMVEMQFADFVSCGFNQIVNNIAKIHYRWGHSADVVIRMPTGGGVGAGPFHSQSTEAWFAHAPGLKIAYPSNPRDAKGLLISAFEDPNPVMFFEHKALYRSIEGEVPESYYNIALGKAAFARRGKKLSIITYGLGVHWALEHCQSAGVDADILDLRTLVPLDYSSIEETVRRTNRVLLLHEDTLFGGIGAEISAFISEHLFEYLDAPVVRVASMDTPVPFAKALENQFMAEARLGTAIQKLLDY